MRVVLIIALCSLFTGCFVFQSPKKRRNKRAIRQMEKARRLDPDLFKIDTVYLVDTVVTVSHSVDTITKIIKHDSVIVVNNERVKLSYFYDTTRKEIFHDIECKEVETIIEREVLIDRFKGSTWYQSANRYLQPILTALMLAVGIFLLLKRIF